MRIHRLALDRAYMSGTLHRPVTLVCTVDEERHPAHDLNFFRRYPLDRLAIITNQRLAKNFANCVRPPDKSMQANGLNKDASKNYLEKLNRIFEMMFEELDMWMIAD